MKSPELMRTCYGWAWITRGIFGNERVAVKIEINKNLCPKCGSKNVNYNGLAWMTCKDCGHMYTPNRS